MRSAIYYPHTELKQKHLLRTALLLWDRLEFIVPFEGFGFHSSDRDVQEGLEIIGHGRCPSSKEKKQAHSIIEDFATKQLPESFLYRGEAINNIYSYGMWPQKLMPETWDMLEELRLVGRIHQGGHRPLQDATGLALMSILADCCAGTTKTRVTDRGAAYATLTNLMIGGQPDLLDTYQRVIPLTLRAINTSEIPLSQIVEFRKREARQGGHSIRDLRHRYLDRLAKQVKTLSELDSDTDKEEINRQFEIEMRDDIAQLRDQIGGARREMAFSKEIVVTTVAAATSLIAATKGLPLDIPGLLSSAGAAVSVGGIFASHSKYAATRAVTMQKHPMAYLYEVGRRY